MLAAQIARKAADEFSTTAKPRFVAGSHGADHQIDHPARRRHLRSELRDSYYEQAQGLVEGGVDLLLIETGFDTRNVKAGAARDPASWNASCGIAFRLMVSGTIERWGAMLAGQPVDAFYASVAHADLLVDRPELRHRSGPDDGSHPHAGARWRRRAFPAIPTRACRTKKTSIWKRPNRWRRSSRNSSSTAG